MTDKPEIITLMGPTASGKTDLALALAPMLNAEIVNVDSALVYRAMDVGSAKPSLEERYAVPHHLIDIREPEQSYSAAEFCRDAGVAVHDIVARGRTPLLVGGTMLYFKALVEGLSDLPPSDPSVRATLMAEAEAKGWPAMHAQLREVDPEAADRIHPNHSQRIARALEVFRIAGCPISALQNARRGGLLKDFRVHQFALSVADRAHLHGRIADRYDAMLAAGLVQEVRRLMARPGFDPGLPAFKAVGYRQVCDHLLEPLDETTLRDRVLAATRQLAKRQITWLRSWPEAQPIDILDQEGQLRPTAAIISEILNFLRQSTV